jgi:hypothetical protein
MARRLVSGIAEGAAMGASRSIYRNFENRKLEVNVEGLLRGEEKMVIGIRGRRGNRCS